MTNWLIVCEGMKYYPVWPALFHKPFARDPVMNQSGLDGTSYHLCGCCSSTLLETKIISPWEMVVWDYFPFGFSLTFRGKLLFLLGVVIFSRRGWRNKKSHPSPSHLLRPCGWILAFWKRPMFIGSAVSIIRGRSKDDGIQCSFWRFPMIDPDWFEKK